MEPLPTLPIGEGLEDLKWLSSAYPFYSFTLLLLKASFTLLLFKDMLLWVRGMGKMPIPPTFYSFTFLLLYF